MSNAEQDAIVKEIIKKGPVEQKQQIHQIGEITWCQYRPAKPVAKTILIKRPRVVEEIDEIDEEYPVKPRTI